MVYVVSILERFLGEHRKHNESSGQISFDCPSCSEDKGMPNGDGKGNLEINYYRDVFKCWVCKDTNSMYGPVAKLIKKYGNSQILKDYNLVKPETTDDKKEKPKIDLKLPEGFKLLKECTSKDFKYNTAISYLRNRGITDDIIEKFDIGYTTKGKFFNRIIVPSYDSFGDLNYFIARWFDKQYTKLKYLNPDVEKQTIIFNENKVNWDATIYLVEGATDHIIIPNSIPLLGKDISDILLYNLYEKAKSKIVILLDGDAIENSKILYKKLNFGDLRNRIRICVPPLDYDPSKIHELRGKKGILALLKRTTTLENFERNN
jgi:hypothetical protein